MSGQAFEFTPIGIVSAGQGAQVFGALAADHTAGGAALLAVAQQSEPTSDVPFARPVLHDRPVRAPQRAGAHYPFPPAQPATTDAPLTGKQLLAGARKRIRELDAILRRMPALKAERDGLARLVAAASGGSPKRRTGSARTPLTETPDPVVVNDANAPPRH